MSDAPDMREYLLARVRETFLTVPMGKPNTIVDVEMGRVLVETETGHQNYASIAELQAFADRVFSGDLVTMPVRGRSAFHMAVVVTVPGVAHAIRPRRVWLESAAATNGDASEGEYDDLMSDADEAATEGLTQHGEHRFYERDLGLRGQKIAAALGSSGSLACEACGFDFEQRYGDIGRGFIEVHHTLPLAEARERQTALEDLAVVCANCHRMIHREDPMLSVAELRVRLAAS